MVIEACCVFIGLLYMVIEVQLVNMAFLANLPLKVAHFRFQDMSFLSSPFYVHNFVIQNFQ